MPLPGRGVFMLILGLSSLFKNDTAAALVRDGAIEAAVEPIVSPWNARGSH